MAQDKFTETFNVWISKCRTSRDWHVLDCLLWLIWTTRFLAWWRHRMETFSALLTLCAGNSPVTGEFPSQRPGTRSFDAFFDLRLNKWLSKQSRHRWIETPLSSSWCHCYDISCHRALPFVSSNLLKFVWDKEKRKHGGRFVVFYWKFAHSKSYNNGPLWLFCSFRVKWNEMLIGWCVLLIIPSRPTRDAINSDIFLAIRWTPIPLLNLRRDWKHTLKIFSPRMPPPSWINSTMTYSNFLRTGHIDSINILPVPMLINHQWSLVTFIWNFTGNDEYIHPHIEFKNYITLTS